MTRNGFLGAAGAVVVAAVLVQGIVSAQAAAPKAQASSASSLGSINIPKAVMADGKPLPAGTYSLRVSTDPVTPVSGQSPDQAKWVEFMQGGQVKGRELATVLSTADAKQIAKQGLPAAGTAKIEALKGDAGDNYMRIWINHGGMNYLVHLTGS